MLVCVAIPARMPLRLPARRGALLNDVHELVGEKPRTGPGVRLVQVGAKDDVGAHRVSQRPGIIRPLCSVAVGVHPHLAEVVPERSFEALANRRVERTPARSVLSGGMASLSLARRARRALVAVDERLATGAAVHRAGARGALHGGLLSQRGHRAASMGAHRAGVNGRRDKQTQDEQSAFNARF